MGLLNPYHRSCRQFVDGHYSEGGRGRYMLHPSYATSPEQYIRAFLLIQKDLKTLFDYIEPADINLDSYSFRIHELLLRTCVEIEANCKAILRENGYRTKESAGYWNIQDYRKINHTHLLGSYVVKLPTWHGEMSERRPFDAWNDNNNLVWYKAYNDTKHDRHSKFNQATFGNLIDAACGLVIVLASQFHTNDYSSPSYLLLEGNSNGDGMELAIGGYFRVKFPNDWPTDMRYDFNWQDLENAPEIFKQFDYTTIES